MKNNEQEQIEEMARKICIFTHHWKRYKTCKECFKANEYACQTYRNCKAFIEEGYRKLPEDSVVISKAEFEQHANEYKNLSIKYDQTSDKHRLCKDANEKLKQKAISASKETAEKFLQLAYDRCLEKSFIKKVEELAKQFGVEIKE